MSWNPRINPSEAALELPDHMINSVISMVLADDHPEDLALIAIESIAAAVGLEIQVGDHDPVKQYKQFEKSALETFKSTGEWHPEFREALTRAAADHCRQIAQIGKGWVQKQQGFKKRLLGGSAGQKIAYLGDVAWPLVNLPSS